MTVEEALFARHRGKNILLDSNLLLVFLTGLVGAHLFERFERVRDYAFDDFELIVQLLSSFTTLITTPHILTEVSNLANKLSGSYRDEWFTNLALLVASEGERHEAREMWTPAKILANMPEFARFGITDSAVTKLASDALVVTDDFKLSGDLRKNGFDVLNFGELRALRRWIR